MGCEIGSIYQRLLETPQPSESWFVIGSEGVFFSVIATESEKDQEVLCQLWKEHNEEDEAKREESTNRFERCGRSLLREMQDCWKVFSVPKVWRIL